MAKVVILDDDEELLDMISTILQDEGYEVNSYSSTRFLNALEEEDADLFLVDVWFEEHQAGLELTKAIRNRSQKLQDIPVVMMSSDPNLPEYADKLNVKTFIEKPIDLPVLLRTIEKLTH